MDHIIVLCTFSRQVRWNVLVSIGKQIPWLRRASPLSIDGNGCGDLEWSSEAQRQHLVRTSVMETLEGVERPLEVAHVLSTVKHEADQWA
jgi:hypothetical protein